MTEDKIVKGLEDGITWNLAVMQAKKEHEKYLKKKASGVVTVEEARADKLNKSIINLSVLDAAVKLLDHIREFDEEYNPEDLEALQDPAVLKDAKIDNAVIGVLIDHCRTGRGILQDIEKSFPTA